MKLVRTAILIMAAVMSFNAIAAPVEISIAKSAELSRALKHKINTDNVTCEALSKRGLKPFQIKNMYISYQYGKSRDMGLSLAAIAFKESSAGDPRFMVNPNDPSAGMYGVTLTNALLKLGLEDTETNRSMVEDMLVNSHGASAWFAMEILGWWVKYHKGDWFKAYRSYNGGSFWRKRGTDESYQLLLKRTWKYAVDVQELTRTIKQCGWK